MATVATVVVIVLIVGLVLLATAAKAVTQYDQGVLLRLGRVIGGRGPGFHRIVPFIDVLHPPLLGPATGRAVLDAVLDATDGTDRGDGGPPRGRARCRDRAVRRGRPAL